MPSMMQRKLSPDERGKLTDEEFFRPAWSELTDEQRATEMRRVIEAHAAPTDLKSLPKTGEFLRQPVQRRGRGRPSNPNTSSNQWHRAALAEAARRITGLDEITKPLCEAVALAMGDDCSRTAWDAAKKRPMQRMKDWHLLRLLPFDLGTSQGQKFRQSATECGQEKKRGRPRKPIKNTERKKRGRPRKSYWSGKRGRSAKQVDWPGSATMLI